MSDNDMYYCLMLTATHPSSLHFLSDPCHSFSCAQVKCFDSYSWLIFIDGFILKKVTSWHLFLGFPIRTHYTVLQVQFSGSVWGAGVRNRRRERK